MKTVFSNIRNIPVRKKYWEEEGVGFSLVFKSNVNMIAVNNIRLVTEFYSADTVFDESSALKHLIARKIIRVDMESEPLNFRKLLAEYKEEVREWMRMNYM